MCSMPPNSGHASRGCLHELCRHSFKAAKLTLVSYTFCCKNDRLRCKDEEIYIKRHKLGKNVTWLGEVHDLDSDGDLVVTIIKKKLIDIIVDGAGASYQLRAPEHQSLAASKAAFMIRLNSCAQTLETCTTLQLCWIVQWVRFRPSLTIRACNVLILSGRKRFTL